LVKLSGVYFPTSGGKFRVYPKGDLNLKDTLEKKLVGPPSEERIRGDMSAFPK